MAKKNKSIFKCNNCGYKSNNFFGICPQCKDGVGEEIEETTIIVDKKGNNITASINKKYSKTSRKSIKDVYQDENERINTGLKQLNSLFGSSNINSNIISGIAKNSLVLLSGEPGVGKSTLLLQIIDFLSLNKMKCAYISGEESSGQIKNRYLRMGCKGDFDIDNNTDVFNIITNYENHDFLIIDSINTAYVEGAGVIGGTSQLKEATLQLMNFAKNKGKTIFLVGQITKDGDIAGPKALEHLVDTVLYLENFDENHQYKCLNSYKNRFGMSNEMVMFEMTHLGLKEIENTSFLFVEKHERRVGTSLTLIYDRNKPIFIEIESLIIEKPIEKGFIQSVSLNNKRLMKVLAILQNHCKIFLYDKIIFVDVIGGIKIDSPSIEYAIAMSIISSYYKEKKEGVFIGELGLDGSIRKVMYEDKLIEECKKSGFKKIHSNKSGDNTIIDFKK